VATVTLSKSLGAQGGAVLSSAAVREHLVNTARPFIYDTGLAPASAGAARAALEIVADQPQLVLRAREVAARLAAACGVAAPSGAVLSVAMSGPREALEAVRTAAGKRVRIGCFRPPSTPDGISRLRLTAHANLDDAEVAHACDVLEGLVSGV
jgi:8-amino-7-oxononanoate synthase